MIAQLLADDPRLQPRYDRLKEAYSAAIRDQGK